MQARIHKYHLTPVGGNSKVGPIPVTTTSKDSCWDGCPLKDVCYGKGLHINLHWKAVSYGNRGYSMDVLCEQVRLLPWGQMMRVNQVGDQPLMPDGETTDRAEAMKLAKACKQRRLRAWTYCHHKQTDENLSTFRALTEAGLTTNASCETEAQVDKVYAQGGLAVLVVDPDEKRTSWKTPGGVDVRVCPEQRGIVANCQACNAYCARRTINTGGGNTKPRDCVAFLGHYAPKKIKALLKTLEVQQ